MKASHKRVKGANLERKVVKELVRSGLCDKAKRSFQSGAHWSWKSDIYTPGLNYSIECKNQERINLWKFWEQAESQRKPYSPPVLMLSSNYRPILAVMKLEDWINLNLELNEYREKAENKGVESS
jgi:hypothetical protein